MHFRVSFVHFAALPLALVIAAGAAAAEPAVEGYSNYAQFATELRKLDESKLAELDSLGTTLGGREIFVLTISQGDAGAKPALLIVGNTYAPQLLGSELAVRMTRQLIERAENDEQIQDLLARYALYVIPRPSPDASEHFFRQPRRERAINERPTDDDRDGRLDEDPPEDLNGDGFITQLRVEDPAGAWMPHPDDPRVLIKADPKKGEQGVYSIYSEGVDNDHDGAWNEDGPGGVDFDRNFTYAYPYFEPGAGPNQVSEVETRAVADFAFDHANIAAVFCFGVYDNLTHPWKADDKGDKFQPSIAAADAPYLKLLAEKSQEIHGGKDAPDAPPAEGDFAHWSWFHYGRWTFCSRGWRVPKVEEEKPKEEKADADEAEEKNETQEDKQASDEKRGADDVNALRWMKEQKIDGFVEWTPIEHPDFPGRKVEVGGFKPYLRLNPPAEELGPLAEKHLAFLVELAGRMPKLRIAPPEVEALGGGIYRVTAEVINDGYLPTFSAAGVESEHLHPVQIEIELPKGAKLLTGHRRARLSPLRGSGGAEEQTWLIRVKQKPSRPIRLKAWSPSVGEAEAAVKMTNDE
jgi:hypothetical protein